MIVRMRWISSGTNVHGNGRQCFQRESRGVLLAGYRIVSDEEITVGQRAQAGELTVIETPDGFRYAIQVEIEPDRGEE